MEENKEKLTLEEQQFILQYIRQGNIDFVQYLPFFYSKNPNHLQGETAVKLIKSLLYNFNEDDPNIQEKLYLTLDKMMDGIIRLKYREDRHSFRFRSADQLNRYISKEMSRIDKNNEEYYLKNMAGVLNYKINDLKYYKMCLQGLKSLYQLYQENNHTLSQEDTSWFYNQILNTQYNFYHQWEKTRMINHLTGMLPLTKKTEEGIIRGAKFKKIDELFANGEYERLGVTKEELLDLLSDYDTYLNSLKKIRKEHVVISKDQLKKINELFVTGRLSEESLQEIIPDAPSQVKSVVLTKYNQEKTRFLNIVSVERKDLSHIHLGYNYNNYKIGTQIKTYQNIAKIIGNLTEDQAQDILVHGQLPEDLKLLLPLVNYFDELNENVMISLLRNYPRILHQMKQDKLIKEETIEEAMPKLYNMLEMAETYDGADDITIAALGKDIIEGIMVDRETSRNPQKYLETYIEMLKREYTVIPPVEGEFLNYYYETAHDSDRDRLLIGKNCNMSCIGPEGEGEKAYYETLNGHTADVLMIKDKETGEFIARSLCFRKGNYVVFAPIHDQEGISDYLYQPGLLSKIANQMLEKATKENDTLEYVFAVSYVDLNDFYTLVQDSYLSDPFPHADLEEVAYLIGNKNSSKPVEIDSTVDIPTIYKTKRDRVKNKDEITSDELTKIKALDILLTKDKEEKEEKSRNFEVIDKEKYDEIFRGQDWYIGIKDGKIIEEVILPIELESQRNEISLLKTKLQTLEMLNEDSKELEIDINRGGKK